MKSQKNERYLEAVFLAAVFGFIFLWAVIQPLNASPDEEMRYQIVEYLVKYGKLPHGGDAEIRNAIWGISYGFNPIFSYMVSAAFVKVTSFFTASQPVLLMAARMVNILLGTGTAFLVRRIARRLFQRETQWLFAVLAMFLPGTLFLFSYVNTDGLAVFSTALIILIWVKAMQQSWNWANCIGLGVGISLCALSYYNAYGIILSSVLFFGVTILMCNEKKGNLKTDFKFLLSRGGVIIAVVLLLAGWWFVRSYLIYDGDILGMRTSSQYAELYAQELYKPSNRITIEKMGMSISEMFFYVPGDWIHNWIVTVAVSFVGTFGFLNIFMPYTLSKIYYLIFAVGLAGLLIGFRKHFFLNGNYAERHKRVIGHESVVIKIIHKKNYWNREAVFRWCMVVSAVIPFVLLVYYAYFSDFQAQGRYLMPGMIPFMYFVALGYENLQKRFIKNEKIRKILCAALSLVLIGFSVYTYTAVFLPNY